MFREIYKASRGCVSVLAVFRGPYSSLHLWDILEKQDWFKDTFKDLVDSFIADSIYSLLSS